MRIDPLETDAARARRKERNRALVADFAAAVGMALVWVILAMIAIANMPQ